MKKITLRFIIVLAALLSVVSWTVSAKKFRIMTFNIRLSAKSDSINYWDNRKEAVTKFINSTAPDVFGLQEATNPQMQDLTKALTKYAYVGVARDDGKEKGEFNPVFYLKDRYKLIKSGTFWLSETPDEPSKGWDAGCYRICTWALLQDIKSGNNFVYANTHLDNSGGDARRNGAKLIKERLSQLSNNLPVLVTGDFNDNNHSQAYLTMATNFFILNDAYKTAKARSGMKSSFHDFGKIADDKGEIIDYIFTSQDVKVSSACIFNSSLGEGRYLSDHHPVIADLNAKNL